MLQNGQSNAIVKCTLNRHDLNVINQNTNSQSEDRGTKEVKHNVGTQKLCSLNPSCYLHKQFIEHMSPHTYTHTCGAIFLRKSKAGWQQCCCKFDRVHVESLQNMFSPRQIQLPNGSLFVIFIPRIYHPNLSP